MGCYLLTEKVVGAEVMVKNMCLSVLESSILILKIFNLITQNSVTSVLKTSFQIPTS